MRAGSRWSALALGAVCASCGGGGDGPGPDAAPDAAPAPSDADHGDLLDRLRALPGVTVVEETDPGDPGVRLFVLMIEQPVDHAAPGGATFRENVTLVHRGFDRPMVVETTGYWNYQGYADTELTAVLDANQIALEHRYFAQSRPVPTDWSYLTIAQAAADEHHVIELLRPIYPAAWVSTGASKGGMTATYHRRFYPDDVDASVPYVAPLSRAAVDPRYAAFLDTIGPPACRQALRDLEVELLSPPRFAAVLARAQDQAANDGIAYTRVAIGPAAEAAITGIEWAFWQYVGVDGCPSVPPTSASDDAMWGFLENTSAVSGSSDPWIAAFDAYYYQAAFELGGPDGGGAYLAGLTHYTAADYAGFLPAGAPTPTYTAAPMADIAGWISTQGARLLFIYGEWDPWSGGMYELGAAADALRVIAPQMTHGAGLATLSAGDRSAAYGKLAAWTGVTPAQKPTHRAARAVPPRLPPALLRLRQLAR